MNPLMQLITKLLPLFHTPTKHIENSVISAPFHAQHKTHYMLAARERNIHTRIIRFSRNSVLLLALPTIECLRISTSTSELCVRFSKLLSLFLFNCLTVNLVTGNFGAVFVLRIIGSKYFVRFMFFRIFIIM